VADTDTHRRDVIIKTVKWVEMHKNLWLEGMQGGIARVREAKKIARKWRDVSAAPDGVLAAVQEMHIKRGPPVEWCSGSEFVYAMSSVL
jgi:hypothetical protein